MKLKAVALLGCGLFALVASAADKLDIRTGTWEVTATTHMSGTPLSREMLGKMTPQQRAEIEAAMKAEAAKGPQTEVTRECITTDDVEQPFKSASTEDCTQSISRTTRTTQEVRLVCTGEYKGTGLLRVNAPNPESMTATLDLRAGEAPEAFTIKSQMKGRWLTAQCEDEDAAEEDEEDTSAPDEYDESEEEDQ
jgi:Protein of unknown function (DUF3617)